MKLPKGFETSTYELEESTSKPLGYFTLFCGFTNYIHVKRTLESPEFPIATTVVLHELNPLKFNFTMSICV